MSAKKTHIGIWLMLMAGAVILGHALVPHHHHFEDMRSPHNKTECASELPEHHDESAQVHCHAFNLLVNQRVNPLIIQPLTQSDFYFYLAVQSSESASQIRAYQRYKYPTFTMLQSRQISTAGYGLRAPPFFQTF